jgi:ATP-dependent Clp protease adaptor protein ClpS
MAQYEEEYQGSVIEDEEVREPDLYRVILLNDDYTPMDFVVEVLVSIFRKSATDAAKIMMDVHKKGRGIVGLYPLDLAMTRVDLVTRRAREREYPLKSIYERA